MSCDRSQSSLLHFWRWHRPESRTCWWKDNASPHIAVRIMWSCCCWSCCTRRKPSVLPSVKSSVAIFGINYYWLWKLLYFSPCSHMCHSHLLKLNYSHVFTNLIVSTNTELLLEYGGCDLHAAEYWFLQSVFTVITVWQDKKVKLKTDGMALFQKKEKSCSFSSKSAYNRLHPHLECTSNPPWRQFLPRMSLRKHKKAPAAVVSCWLRDNREMDPLDKS